MQTVSPETLWFLIPGGLYTQIDGRDMYTPIQLTDSVVFCTNKRLPLHCCAELLHKCIRGDVCVASPKNKPNDQSQILLNLEMDTQSISDMYNVDKRYGAVCNNNNSLNNSFYCETVIYKCLSGRRHDSLMLASESTFKLVTDKTASYECQSESEIGAAIINEKNNENTDHHQQRTNTPMTALHIPPSCDAIRGHAFLTLVSIPPLLEFKDNSTRHKLTNNTSTFVYAGMVNITNPYHSSPCIAQCHRAYQLLTNAYNHNKCIKTNFEIGLLVAMTWDTPPPPLKQPCVDTTDVPSMGHVVLVTLQISKSGLEVTAENISDTKKRTSTQQQLVTHTTLKNRLFVADPAPQPIHNKYHVNDQSQHCDEQMQNERTEQYIRSFVKLFDRFCRCQNISLCHETIDQLSCVQTAAECEVFASLNGLLLALNIPRITIMNMCAIITPSLMERVLVSVYVDGTRTIDNIAKRILSKEDYDRVVLNDTVDVPLTYGQCNALDVALEMFNISIITDTSRTINTAVGLLKKWTNKTNKNNG